MPRPLSKKALREAAAQDLAQYLGGMDMLALQDWMVHGVNPLCPISPAYAFDKPAERQVPMVPSEGDAPCDIMVVAEAPGEQEQRMRRLLIGPSGQRFETLLRLTQRTRSSIYMTNREKHRPIRGRSNRTPSVEEFRACDVVLDREVALVQPEVIIALGANAAHYFDPQVRLEKDHGMARLLPSGAILVPWYHPAYTMRNGDYWPVAVADAKRLWDVVKRLRGGVKVDEVAYALGTDEEAAQRAWQAGTIGFDIETTSPKRGGVFAVDEAEIVGYSVSWAPGQAMYVPGVPGPLMRMVLESSMVKKVCHSAFFEYGRLQSYGITLRNFEDTKIAAWMLQKLSTHLKALARQELSRDPIDYTTVTQGRDMSEIPPEEVCEYAAADADNTRMLWPALEGELHHEDLWDLYEQTEMPLVPVLADMHALGVLVDQEAVAPITTEIEAAAQSAYITANRCLRDSGVPAFLCDVGSSDKLANALELLHAPIRDRTEVKRQLVTDEEHLEGIRDWNPELVEAVLLFKHYRKLLGYARSYAELADVAGVLHPEFVQAGHGEETGDRSSGAPVTGRLSCRNPNLQNQPNKGRGGAYASLVAAWGQRLRRCIVARPGCVLVSADVEQEEPRIFTFLTHDKEMQADFDAGRQPYGPIGEAIYGRPVSKSQDPHEWMVAKTYFLGRLYGSRPEKLIEEDPTLTEAQVISADAEVVRRYPGLGRYFAQTVQEVRRDGMIRDYFKRLRKLFKIYNGRKEEKEAAYREAANFKIQGPAASVMKKWMRRIWEQLRRRDIAGVLVLSVHDEVVLEVQEEDVARAVAVLRDTIKGIMPIDFPLEIKVGKNWGEMKGVTQ